MARIALADIQKKFRPVWKLRDVNIDIADEEFIGFLGPSGCSKTTTMRMIAGRLEAGSLTAPGVQVPGLPLRCAGRAAPGIRPEHCHIATGGNGAGHLQGRVFGAKPTGETTLP